LKGVREMPNYSEQALKSYTAPNSFSKLGDHIVELTFQADEYKATLYTVLGGNQTGADVLGCIAEAFCDGDFEQSWGKVLTEDQIAINRKHAEYDADDCLYKLNLYHDHSILEIDGDNAHRYLVGMRIIKWIKEGLK
jgi:hypothetical protein